MLTVAERFVLEMAADGGARGRLREYHRIVRDPIVVAVALVAALACSRPPEGRRYPLTGQGLAVHLERSEIIIRHDEIPGFMDAMTMPFGVRDPKLLTDRIPGDIVRGTLFVGETTTYLESLEKTGFATVDDTATPHEGALLVPGDAVGDLDLVDQHGAKRKLGDFQGKAVAVTFIFTRCPLPDFCPALDRGFSRLHSLLAREKDLAGKVQLLSLSFDPAHDTPEVLARHARGLGADGASWLYATAATADIDRFGAGLGLEVLREASGGITHNLRTALVDPGGRLAKLVAGSDWKAEDLLADLRHLVSRS